MSLYPITSFLAWLATSLSCWILTVLPGPSSRSTNFDGELILQSIFLVLSFRLEHQAWFRVCVVSVVQWPYASPLLFLDVVAVRLLLHEISRQLCRDHHQHFELFQDINWMHEEKYHPCPQWFVLSSTTLLPSVQHKLVRVSGNPIAFKLMVDISFLDHWLSDHHSNIDHAT